MSELQVENVRPVTPDRDALEAISTAINIRGEQVMQVQHELLEAQKQQDLMDEQEFYAQVSIYPVFNIHVHTLLHIQCMVKFIVAVYIMQYNEL